MDDLAGDSCERWGTGRACLRDAGTGRAWIGREIAAGIAASTQGEESRGTVIAALSGGAVVDALVAPL
jgi:hypothetical protein